MSYSPLVHEYFEAAERYAGTLAGQHTRRGTGGSRERGCWVQFDLQAEQGRISAARFLALACPHVIAVAAWLTATAVSQPLQAQLPESIAALRARFELPTEKLGRLLIVEDAWRAAMAAAIDYAPARPHVGE